MKLVKTREHSDSANLRQGQTLTGDSLSRRKHIVSSLTLKRAPRSSKMVPLDRTHTTSY